MGRNLTWPETDPMAGNRNAWPETTSLIWKTPPVTDVCKTGRNGSVATSLGRKTDPMAGNRNHWPGNDFTYLENAAGD